VDFHCSGNQSSPCQEDLHYYSTDTKPPVKPRETRVVGPPDLHSLAPPYRHNTINENGKEHQCSDNPENPIVPAQMIL